MKCLVYHYSTPLVVLYVCLRQQVLRFLLHYTLFILSSHWKQNFPRALKASPCHGLVVVVLLSLLGRVRLPVNLRFWPEFPVILLLNVFGPHWKVALLYNGISQWLSWLPLTPFSRTNGAGNFGTTRLRASAEVGRSHTFVHTSWSPINYSKAWLLYDLVGGEKEKRPWMIH